jgi:pimeloyl-ACP methyl ester carboxylesterase
MVATEDHAIPPATERFMAQRAHADTVEVKSSHVPMISQPDAVTHLILEAAESLG